MHFIGAVVEIIGFFTGLITITALIISRFPAIPRAVLANEVPRVPSVDGARGILALLVVLFHGHRIADFPITDPAASLPRSEILYRHLVTQTGSAAVALFFMITAWIFCGRILSRKGGIDAASFLTNRLLRIGPMYLAAIGLLLVAALGEANWTLAVPPIKLLRQLVRWLPFRFLTTYGLNGLSDGMEVIGPIWSLEYEVAFYLAVPVMAIGYRLIGRGVVLWAVIAVLGFWWSPLFYLFLGGLAGAQIAGIDPDRTAIWWQIAGVAGVIIDVCLFSMSQTLLSAALLTPCFVAIVQGRGVLRLLGARPLRYLGEISYSVYVLHNPLLYMLVRWQIGFDRFVHLSHFAFLATMVAFAVVIGVVSTITFLTIERPCMRFAA